MRLGISQVVYDLHPSTNESLVGEYHPSVNILSRKSNKEGGGYCRSTLTYRSSVKPRVRVVSGCF